MYFSLQYLNLSTTVTLGTAESGITMLFCVVTDFHKNGRSKVIDVEYKPMLPVA